MGRRLHALVRQAGLRDVAVDPLTVVFTEFETADQVLSIVERLDRIRDDGALPRPASTGGSPTCARPTTRGRCSAL